MKRGTTNLKSRGLTTFLCLSNSNYVYITTILKVRFRPASSRHRADQRCSITSS